MPGDEVLDIGGWIIDKNDKWIKSIIKRRMAVYVASPLTFDVGPQEQT
ncbi:hypothetical protein [Planobispora longispora]|nr:hypothetical protein [Planobispora longispora]